MRLNSRQKKIRSKFFTKNTKNYTVQQQEQYTRERIRSLSIRANSHAQSEKLRKRREIEEEREKTRQQVEEGVSKQTEKRERHKAIQESQLSKRSGMIAETEAELSEFRLRRSRLFEFECRVQFFKSKFSKFFSRLELLIFKSLIIPIQIFAMIQLFMLRSESTLQFSQLFEIKYNMLDYFSKKQETPVYLNIYNFWSKLNKCCSCIKLGVYHTAIEIEGIEYMYYGFDGDETGVIEIQPKSAAYQFSEQLFLGTMPYSYYELENQVIEPLRLQFIGNRYDLLQNNCNHFAYRMAEMLGVTKVHPKQRIFCVTDFCNIFRCCIPNCILNGRLDWFYDKQQAEFEDSLFERSFRKSRRSSIGKKSDYKYEELNQQGHSDSSSKEKHIENKRFLQSGYQPRRMGNIDKKDDDI